MVAALHIARKIDGIDLERNIALEVEVASGSVGVGNGDINGLVGPICIGRARNERVAVGRELAALKERNGLEVLVVPVCEC